jgi:DNA-binding MarR family transcriptional regulator
MRSGSRKTVTRVPTAKADATGPDGQDARVSSTSSGVDLPPSQSIGYPIREVHRAFNRSLEARIGRFGITSGMWWFLRLLWIEDGLSQAELSDRLKVMGPTTVKAMERLARFGLITRQQVPTDKRKSLIFLTEQGHSLKDQLMPLAIEVNEIGGASLSPDERDGLQKLLKRVLDNLLSDGATQST